MTTSQVRDSLLLRPGDAGYDQATSTWNLEARHRPAAVVVAERSADVVAAVRYAGQEGLGVGVMATGHGTATPSDGGVLVNTARMQGVRIDPRGRTARVAAGVRWTDVIARTAAHGLSGLPGSAPHVGVVGYTSGGGFGWLGRELGFAAHSVTRAELVTADGSSVTASATENPDLFWGVNGGAGNFGVVTALEFELHQVSRVYAGNLFYPVDRAQDVLGAYADWTRTLPDEMASACAFRSFPALPAVPEPLRGKKFVTVRACFCGPDLAAGEGLVAQLRARLGAAAIDTVAVLPVEQLDTISMDPVNPVGARTHSDVLPDLTGGAIDTLVELGSESPLVMLELRQLGGALSRPGPRLRPIGSPKAAFTLNAIGVTPTPELATAVGTFLPRLADAIRPHATGATYVNFLDLEGATPERVRAAYSADDWARLVQLKDRYDPTNTFRFNRNIPPTGGSR